MKSLFCLLKLILAIFVLLIFHLPISSVQAQESQTTEMGALSNLKVEIQIQNDSSLEVSQEFNDLSLYTSSFIWEVDSTDLKDLKIEENGIKIDPSQIKIQGGDVARLSFPLSYYSNANLKISYRSLNNLEKKDGRIFLKNIIFNRPNVYIKQTEVRFKIPEDARGAENGQRYYAIHGIEQASQNISPDGTLVFKAAGASSNSSFTIEDSFQSATLNFPLGQRLKFFFNNLSIFSLALLSLPLPIITLIFLFFLHLRYKQSVRIKRNLRPSDRLPDQIPPALLDLLYHGEITSAGVSATILDLIKKGTILVIDKDEGISFGKKESDAPLLTYEEKILNELFEKQKMKTNPEELKKIEAEKLIDPIFASVYREIYRMGTERGYFAKNPRSLKIKNHLAGIILFLLSIFLYIMAIVFFPANPLMLLPPFGVTVASLLILYLAKIIPPRTAAGKLELEKWLSFKRFLLGHHPIKEEENLAIKYLPQAEALTAIDEWILNFKNLPQSTPDFYVSSLPYVGTCEWMVSTVNASRAMAKEIEELKGY